MKLKKLLEGLTGRIKHIQQETKERYNTITTLQEQVKATQVEFKESLTLQMEEYLDKKLSSVENNLVLIEVKVQEIEKDLGQEITHIKNVTGVKEEVTEMKKNFLKSKNIIN